MSALQEPASGGVLVTGSHRSGSTWVGSVIAQAPGTGYINEIFSPAPHTHGFFRKPITHWFEYIDEGNSELYFSYVDSMLAFKYPTAKILKGANSFRAAVRSVKDQAGFLRHRLCKDIPILKDSFAVFAAPWLAATFGMRVLVMIRHPAAFYLSIKVKDWHFDFNNFLEQPELMNRYLHPFEAEIREQVKSSGGILAQATLLWNCIHTVVASYMLEHPQWQFVRHEDLSFAPIAGFERIYGNLQLEFTEAVVATILRSSDPRNPAFPEQWKTAPLDDYRRNSKVVPHNWKRMLTPIEISAVRERTNPVASIFYRDEDWRLPRTCDA